MHVKIQGSGTIFRVSFALSKTPHLHRAYLVTVRKRKSMTVCKSFQQMPCPDQFWLHISSHLVSSMVCMRLLSKRRTCNQGTNLYCLQVQLQCKQTMPSKLCVERTLFGNDIKCRKSHIRN